MTTIAQSAVVLYDGLVGKFFPGITPRRNALGAILTNSTEFNVATPKFKPGSKVSLLDPTTNDWHIFIYKQLGVQEGTAPAVTTAARSIVGLEFLSDAANGKLTNKSATALTDGPAAIMLAPMTNQYYGWFFCGGRIPTGLCSDLDGTYLTDGNVAADSPLTLIDVSNVLGFGLGGANTGRCGVSSIIDS